MLGLQYDLDAKKGVVQDCAVVVVYKRTEDDVAFCEASEEDFRVNGQRR